MLSLITYIHISLGFIAFVSSIIAIATKVFSVPHRWHALSGKVFTAAMIGIFISALIIVAFSFNLFLTLVAIFSVYMAVSGYLMAKNRSPKPTSSQRLLSITTFIFGLAMLAVGTMQIMQQEALGPVMLSFGIITLVLSGQELYYWYTQSMVGSLRIAAHLSRMLGGTIAIFTAATTVNLDIEPIWLSWLFPTFFLVPLIVYWNVKLLRR